MSKIGRTFVAGVSERERSTMSGTVRIGKRAAGTLQALVTDFDDPSIVSEVYQDDDEVDGDGEFAE